DQVPAHIVAPDWALLASYADSLSNRYADFCLKPHPDRDTNRYPDPYSHPDSYPNTYSNAYAGWSGTGSASAHSYVPSHRCPSARC
ncbi:MAG: hypothetical protein V3T92_02340, partial [Anaerolineae bacterium]